MEFDKINAFLATAIGGLIFKWLAGGVSTFWSWLNKSYPEEDFLVSEIGIAKPLIRLSFCKYKISTKPNTKHQTPNTKHQTPNTKHQTPNTKHQTPNTKHQT